MSTLTTFLLLAPSLPCGSIRSLEHDPFTTCSSTGFNLLSRFTTTLGASATSRQLISLENRDYAELSLNNQGQESWLLLQSANKVLVFISVTPLWVKLEVRTAAKGRFSVGPVGCQIPDIGSDQFDAGVRVGLPELGLECYSMVRHVP